MGRSALMAGSSNSYSARSNRVFGKETEETKHLDDYGVLNLQKSMMKKQDEDLDQLSMLIQKQKHIGVSISEELDVQNRMLDDLMNQVDLTEGKVASSHRKLKKLS